MVAEFYGVIHAMEEAQKMRLTNVWLECDSALVCVMFTVGKSGLGLLIFFVKEMHVLIN